MVDLAGSWHAWHPQVPPNTHAVGCGMESSRARGWRSRTPLAPAMPPPVPVGAAAPGPCTCRLVATPLSLDRATVHMVALCATQTQTHTLVGFDRLVRALVPAPGQSVSFFGLHAGAGATFVNRNVGWPAVVLLLLPTSTGLEPGGT